MGALPGSVPQLPCCDMWPQCGWKCWGHVWTCGPELFCGPSLLLVLLPGGNLRGRAGKGPQRARRSLCQGTAEPGDGRARGPQSPVPGACRHLSQDCLHRAGVGHGRHCTLGPAVAPAQPDPAQEIVRTLKTGRGSWCKRPGGWTEMEMDGNGQRDGRNGLPGSVTADNCQCPQPAWTGFPRGRETFCGKRMRT